MSPDPQVMIWIAANVFQSKDVKDQIKDPVDGVAKERLGELLAFLKEGG